MKKIPKIKRLVEELGHYDGWSIRQDEDVITLTRNGRMVRLRVPLREAIYVLVNKCRADTGKKPFFNPKPDRNDGIPHSFSVRY